MRFVGADGDIGRVAKAAIGDDAGGAAHLHPRDQDIAGRGGAPVLARVDDHDVSRRDLLDGLALRMRAVFEDAEMIEVLARRDVAQGIGLPDHARRVGIEQPDILQEDVAETLLEERRGEGRGADLGQQVAGLRAEGGEGHGASFAWWRSDPWT
jgi:hypothetical protein